MGEEKDVNLDEFDELQESPSDDPDVTQNRNQKKSIAKKFESRTIYDEKGNLNIDLFMDILSSDIRRRILEKLAKAPRYLADLESELSVTKQAVKKHLKILMDVGLVETDSDLSQFSEGPKIYYRIKSEVNISFHIDITSNYWNISNSPFKNLREALDNGEYPFTKRIAPLLSDFVKKPQSRDQEEVKTRPRDALPPINTEDQRKNKPNFIIIDQYDNEFDITKYFNDETIGEEQAAKLRDALARKIWNPEKIFGDRLRTALAGLLEAGDSTLYTPLQSDQEKELEKDHENKIREKVRAIKTEFIDALNTIINVDDFISQYDERRTEFIKYKIWVLGRIKQKIGATFNDDLLAALILYNLLFEYEHFHDTDSADLEGLIKSIILERNPNRAGIRKESKDAEEYSAEAKRKAEKILWQLKIMLEELGFI